MGRVYNCNIVSFVVQFQRLQNGFFQHCIMHRSNNERMLSVLYWPGKQHYFQEYSYQTFEPMTADQYFENQLYVQTLHMYLTVSIRNWRLRKLSSSFQVILISLFLVCTCNRTTECLLCYTILSIGRILYLILAVLVCVIFLHPHF